MVPWALAAGLPNGPPGAMGWKLSLHKYILFTFAPSFSETQTINRMEGESLYLDENGAISLMRTIIFSLLILVSKEKWLLPKDRTLQWFLNYHQTVWFPDSLIHEQEMYLCSYLIWLFSPCEVLQKFLNLEGVYNALTLCLLFIMKRPL